MPELLCCYRCGQPAVDAANGVIYVRREVGGRWQSVPICQPCWDHEEPGRRPIRLYLDGDDG